MPTAERDNRTVCVVLPYPPSVTETFITSHIEHLPSRIVVVTGWRPQIGGRTVLPFSRRVFYKLLRSASGSGLERETTSAYIKAFRDNNTKAVLAEYGTTGVLAIDACRSLKIPLIVYFFGYDASIRSVLEAHAASYKRMFHDAAAVIACSRSIKRKLVSLGASADKVHYIPCGVDCGQFSGAMPAEAPPLFLAVGRFVEKKAPHHTIEAFAIVHSTYPSARLKMIGDGPLWGDCQKLAKSLGVSDAIEFSGTLPHNALRGEMHQARCFVQHSIEAPSGDCEGTPVGILEAGASGLPVISTRHAGIPDVVIDGETGFLVDEGDVQGMAKCMLRMAQDPSLASKLGQAARKRIGIQFSIEKTVPALWHIIESCMNGVQPTAGED